MIVNKINKLNVKNSHLLHKHTIHKHTEFGFQRSLFSFSSISISATLLQCFFGPVNILNFVINQHV